MAATTANENTVNLTTSDDAPLKVEGKVGLDELDHHLQAVGGGHFVCPAGEWCDQQFYIFCWPNNNISCLNCTKNRDWNALSSSSRKAVVHARGKFAAHGTYITRVMLSADVRHLATCSAEHSVGTSPTLVPRKVRSSISAG
jgi:hypothetical protein